MAVETKPKEYQVTLTKTDLLPEEDKKELPVKLGDCKLRRISSASGEGLKDLKTEVFKLLDELDDD